MLAPIGAGCATEASAALSAHRAALAEAALVRATAAAASAAVEAQRLADAKVAVVERRAREAEHRAAKAEAQALEVQRQAAVSEERAASAQAALGSFHWSEDVLSRVVGNQHVGEIDAVILDSLRVHNITDGIVDVKSIGSSALRRGHRVAGGKTTWRCDDVNRSHLPGTQALCWSGDELPSSPAATVPAAGDVRFAFASEDGRLRSLALASEFNIVKPANERGKKRACATPDVGDCVVRHVVKSPHLCVPHAGMRVAESLLLGSGVESEQSACICAETPQPAVQMVTATAPLTTTRLGQGKERLEVRLRCVIIAHSHCR